VRLGCGSAFNLEATLYRPPNSPGKSNIDLKPEPPVGSAPIVLGPPADSGSEPGFPFATSNVLFALPAWSSGER
jgi:hypothetical protein